MTKNSPIHVCIDRWHDHMSGRLDGGLDAILHPDVVFLSPIVFTPQTGIDITKIYLTAAGGTLGGEPADDGSGGFGYTKQILDGHQAMLEFETQIDGKYVNGVDIITCDDDAMIVEFKVMIRPLQAINLVQERMKAMISRERPPAR